MRTDVVGNIGLDVTPAVVACELCSADARHDFDARGFPMYRCPSCRYAFTHPAPGPAQLATIYDDSYFAGGGDGMGYADYVAEGPLLRERGFGYGELLRRHGAGGRVLDVGAAAGFMLQGYIDAGWDGAGIELNPAMAAHARERLGLDVRTGTLESLPAGELFDAVSFVQVVAHFADPRGALEHAAKLTRPGGWWLFETWNCASLTARAFGATWHAYAPPSAVRALSPRALDALTGGLGFVPVARGTPRKVIDARHAKVVLSSLAARSIVARGLEKLIGLLPGATRLVYPAEDVFWALYRRR
jgi:SAM-dependent methyltransferase